MTKIVRPLLIGFLIVTHFAEFGSVALFVLHVRFGSSTPVDHLATIVLICGTAIFLDCWLLLVLFDAVSANRRLGLTTWSMLVLTSALFPVLYLTGVDSAESPYLAASTQRLGIFAVFPVVAWLIRLFWKQRERG